MNMKVWFIGLFALGMSQGTAAQDCEAGACAFHTAYEQYPTFMGGDLAVFREWVCRNARYPREAFDRGEQGRVLIVFVIDTLGNVTRVEPLDTAIPEKVRCREDSLGTTGAQRKGGGELRKARPGGFSESPALIREVVRVVRNSPRWTPGRMGRDNAKSVKVPVKYTLPIDFLLKPDPSRRWPVVVPPAEWSPRYVFCPARQ